MLKISGVYSITCTITGKIYIGSSTRSVEARIKLHKKRLIADTHHSVLLQRAWNKYGEISFVFEMLEEYPPKFCTAMEQWWINMTRSFEPKYGFNICSVAGSSYGIRFKLKHKRIFPADHGEKMRAITLGVPKSAQHKAAVGKANWLPVNQYSLEGTFIKEWESVKHILIDYPNFQWKNIQACCRGTRLNAHKFKWSYKNGNTNRRQRRYTTGNC